MDEVLNLLALGGSVYFDPRPDRGGLISAIKRPWLEKYADEHGVKVETTNTFSGFKRKIFGNPIKLIKSIQVPVKQKKNEGKAAEL